MNSNIECLAPGNGFWHDGHDGGTDGSRGAHESHGRDALPVNFCGSLPRGTGCLCRFPLTIDKDRKNKRHQKLMS